MKAVPEIPQRLAWRKIDLANSLGMNLRTLERMEAEGRGPPGRFTLGRSVFYEAGAVSEWIRERAKEAA